MSTIAQRWEDGMQAEWDAYEAVVEHWPDWVNDVGHDPYDNSLEVYFSPNVPADFQATVDDLRKLTDAIGTRSYFLNYADGTLQYGGISLPEYAEKHPHNITERKASTSSRTKYAETHALRIAYRRCARLEGALLEMQAEANMASEWLKAGGDIGSACNALDKAAARARGAVGE